MHRQVLVVVWKILISEKSSYFPFLNHLESTLDMLQQRQESAKK